MEADGTTAINSAASLGSNDDLLNETVPLTGNSKGNASEDEGYFSGSEEFELPVDKPVLPEQASEGGNSDVLLGDSLDKVESFPSSEANLNDEAVEGDENEKFDEAKDVEVETAEGKNEVADSVLNSKEDLLESKRGNDVAEEVDAEGEESKNNAGDVSSSLEDVVSQTEDNVASEGLTVEPESSELVEDGEFVDEKNKVNPDILEAVVLAETEENGGDTVHFEAAAHESADNIPEQGAVESDLVQDMASSEDVNAELSNGDQESVTTDDVVYKSMEATCDGASSEASENETIAKFLAEEVPVFHAENETSFDEAPEEIKTTASSEPVSPIQAQEIRDVESQIDVKVPPEHPVSESDTESNSGAFNEISKLLIENSEREPEAGESYLEEFESEHGAVAESSPKHSEGIDGEIVTDSEEDVGSEDDGDGKELFDSAALAALLKAAAGADSDGGTITITSQDGSRLFSVERPAGLGPALRSLRPSAARLNRPSLFSSSNPGVGESETNVTEEEKKKLDKLQQIRVKYLRLVHRLGLSPEEPTAAQVLYRLQLLGGRQNSQFFNVDDAKKSALELEAQGKDDLDFSLNILVLGKYGAGKSSTINSLFGEEKVLISAFDKGTTSAKEVCGFIDGVKVRVLDTPGLKASASEQSFNRGVLSSVKNLMKKTPSDVVLYVDRLDSQSRDLDDLPLLETATKALGSSIWRNGIVTLTHAGSAPPDGPSGAPLSYEVFISQRSHVVQQSIAHAVGEIRMMSPSLMNPVSLVENHPSCRRNREGQKILPNGQSWRPQLLLLCYSMKILSEASSVARPPQDPFDHRKLFGFRVRSPPLPYMLSSMLQSRPHPKLPMDQGGESVDSDIDLDDLMDSDQEEEDEYDQLPAFRPLRKAQVELLSKEQRKAYFEEYDYRVKLFNKKQWKEELRRMKEMKKNGTNAAASVDIGFPEDDAEFGAAAPVSIPLPDMALPPTFDGDNPGYRYRFLEPVSQFLARPVLVTHGWDHDCGYDAVNLDHSLAIANRFPVSYTIQVSKDKKDFSISLDSSIAAKYGDKISAMANFDIQSMGKQLAYILRAESKFSKMKKHKAGGGISITFLGENVIPGLKIEDHISLGKQYAIVGSAGAVKSQSETAYGANIELQRREVDYPIGQVQSTLSMSIVKWRGDLALGFNGLAQFAVGRNSKIAVRAGINNKLSGQITMRTSSSEHLSLALAALIPLAQSVYQKLRPSVGVGDKYSIY